MGNLDMEKELIENGFTEKEVSKLKELAERDDESLIKLLTDLKKRFFAGFVIILAFLGIWLFTLLSSSSDTFESFSFATVIVSICVYFFIPMKLATKAYVYLAKNKD